MKSAIEEMYRGERGSYDSVRSSEKALKNIEEVIKYDNDLREKLKENEELSKLFENFKEAIDEQGSIEAFDRFKEGFRFAFLLAIDVFGEK